MDTIWNPPAYLVTVPHVVRHNLPMTARMEKNRMTKLLPTINLNVPLLRLIGKLADK